MNGAQQTNLSPASQPLSNTTSTPSETPAETGTRERSMVNTTPSSSSVNRVTEQQRTMPTPLNAPPWYMRLAQATAAPVTRLAVDTAVNATQYFSPITETVVQTTHDTLNRRLPGYAQAGQSLAEIQASTALYEQQIATLEEHFGGRSPEIDHQAERLNTTYEAINQRYREFGVKAAALARKSGQQLRFMIGIMGTTYLISALARQQLGGRSSAETLQLINNTQNYAQYAALFHSLYQLWSSSELTDAKQAMSGLFNEVLQFGGQCHEIIQSLLKDWSHIMQDGEEGIRNFKQSTQNTQRLLNAIQGQMDQPQANT